MNFEVTPTSHTLEEYRARGGYATLEKALDAASPPHITKEVTASGLLGHGGAAFPVGRKWGVMKPNPGEIHYLCANADEGEPGTFKDRWILENAPHLLVESMLITSYALGVRHAFVYIRGEFDLPYRRIQGAIDEAYAAGYLGKPVFGTDFTLDIVVYRGAGSYVCGEASGLITSIEGRKPYPRNRPPRLTVRGLYQKPTVINNVESLANITGIVRMGAEEFKKIGTRQEPRHAAHLHLRPHREARRLRGRVRLPVGEVPRRGLRRHAARREAEVRGPRRHLHQGAHARGDRAAHALPRVGEPGGLRASAPAA